MTDERIEQQMSREELGRVVVKQAQEIVALRTRLARYEACGHPVDNLARIAVLEEGGVTIPCPARGLAVLGFVDPVHVPCSKVEGHDGEHIFGPIRWGRTE